MITVLKFLVISEFQWRHAEMIFHVFTKKGWVRKTEAIADLLDAQVGLLQVVTDILHDVLRNPFVGSLPGVSLTDGREVLG